MDGSSASDGEIIGKTSFDPFGEIIEQDGNLVVPFGFAGYFREGKSGVYQLPARSYHSRFGRFLQKDPMGLVDGFNLYAYAHHAPGSLIDYWGFDSSRADRGWVTAGLEWLKGLKNDEEFWKKEKEIRNVVGSSSDVGGLISDVIIGVREAKVAAALEAALKVREAKVAAALEVCT